MSTSPAASTARRHREHVEAHEPVHAGDPIAESSAPMVVGMRVTKSATRTMIVTAPPAYREARNRCPAKTKMIVNPASKILSAISFGVFCRSAPSTSAIIRSRKVEPGAAVIRTLIQSESTCVPPVTAERSPPLADHRRGFAGDRRLVDRGDAFDHLAVGRE